MMEKRRYCKYKAATILKAIKEGTTPAPGPPGVGYATVGNVVISNSCHHKHTTD
jgi:hypothetical protein